MSVAAEPSSARPGATGLLVACLVGGALVVAQLTLSMILIVGATLFVGTFLAIRLKSIVRSLLSLVPVLIAVGAANLVAWSLDLKLSPVTAVGGPLVVAACTPTGTVGIVSAGGSTATGADGDGSSAGDDGLLLDVGVGGCSKGGHRLAGQGQSDRLADRDPGRRRSCTSVRLPLHDEPSFR